MPLNQIPRDIALTKVQQSFSTTTTTTKRWWWLIDAEENANSPFSISFLRSFSFGFQIERLYSQIHLTNELLIDRHRQNFIMIDNAIRHTSFQIELVDMTILPSRGNG